MRLREIDPREIRDIILALGIALFALVGISAACSILGAPKWAATAIGFLSFSSTLAAMISAALYDRVVDSQKKN